APGRRSRRDDGSAVPILDLLRQAWDALASTPDLRLYLGLGWLLYLLLLGGWIVLQKREPVATLSWLLGLALLPYVGFLVYHVFGPQRIERQRLRRAPAGGRRGQVRRPAGRHRRGPAPRPPRVLHLAPRPHRHRAARRPGRTRPRRRQGAGAGRRLRRRALPAAVRRAGGGRRRTGLVPPHPLRADLAAALGQPAQPPQDRRDRRPHRLHRRHERQRRPERAA